MTDYSLIIKACIEPLVDDPSQLLIRLMDREDELERSRDVHYLVACPDNVLGKLIGRHGSVADAIRTVVNVKARDDRKRVHIKFESFSSEKEAE